MWSLFPKGLHPWLKPAIFAGALVPLARILELGLTGGLGADPIALALNQLGLLAITFLVASLGCTPFKAFMGWTWPIRIRRMLGLFAFFYASMHFLTYVVLDQTFDFKAILKDILERKFIFLGFAALLLLIPLAATSTNAMVRRLGFKRWKLLHRLAYAAAVLAVVHFILRVKKDLRQPLIYGALLGVLMAARLVDWLLHRPRPQKSPTVPQPLEGR